MSLIFLLFSVSVFAEDLTPKDFAHGYDLNFTSGDSVYEATLTQELYGSFTRHDLGDMRVFNAKLEIVPHAIVSQRTTSKLKDVSAPKKLKFFPIYGKKGSHPDRGRIRVETDAKGTIVDVIPSVKGSKKSRVIQAYLIDTSDLKENFERFKISVQSDQTYLRNVRIEASDDLRVWRTIVHKGILARLEFMGETLIQDEIRFSYSKHKYYRLSWNQTDGVLNLQGIEGFEPKKRVTHSPDLMSITRSGTKDEESKDSFVYDVEAPFPIRQAQVQFSQPNSLARVKLQGSHKSDGPWSHLDRETLYSVTQKGTRLENLLLQFSPKRYRFYRLVFTSGLEGLGSQAPSLNFQYSPEKLRFLARGETPFILASGSAKVTPYSGVKLDAKLQESFSLARLGQRKILGGERKLTELPPQEFPWKVWLLWAVLLGGVLAMGLMAKNLLKTMKNDS